MRWTGEDKVGRRVGRGWLRSQEGLEEVKEQLWKESRVSDQEGKEGGHNGREVVGMRFYRWRLSW